MITMKQALNGSERDRLQWKTERYEEALFMANVYKGKPQEDGWRKEAERYRLMILPEDRK